MCEITDADDTIQKRGRPGPEEVHEWDSPLGGPDPEEGQIEMVDIGDMDVRAGPNMGPESRQESDEVKEDHVDYIGTAEQKEEAALWMAQINGENDRHEDDVHDVEGSKDCHKG